MIQGVFFNEGALGSLVADPRHKMRTEASRTKLKNTVPMALRDENGGIWTPKVD